MTREKVTSVGRVALLLVASIEGFVFLGAGAVGLLIGLHLMPSDPGPNGQPPDYGPWHATTSDILDAFALFGLAVPAVVGILAILNDSFPMRSTVVGLAALGIATVATFATVFVVAGWTLA